MNGPLSNYPPPAPLPSPAAQWYRGTSELPLWKFIKIAVHLDLSELIIEGTPSEQDLSTAWGTIYQEFLDALQDKKGQYRVRLLNEIDRLEYDYRVIQLCVQRLSIGPSQWAVEQLRRRVRVSGAFNPEDQAQYFGNLVVVMNQSLSLRHRLIERQAELDIMFKREGGPNRSTMQQFDHLIARVSLFSKFQINRKETMTSEFMELYREMKRQEEAVTHQMEMQKARR